MTYVFARGQYSRLCPVEILASLHNSISMRFVKSDGPRGRVVGLSPSRTGEGYFLRAHEGQLACVRSAAAAPLASCTTLPWSSAVNLPDWRRIRPSTMTVSTLLGCASETSAS